MGWREDLRPASFRGVEFHVMYPRAGFALTRSRRARTCRRFA